MTESQVDDLNVVSQELLISPDELKAKLPLSDKARDVVTDGRAVIRNILDRKDHRIFIVIGPCSIHDVEAAKDYAHRLKKLADEVSDTIYIVMRVYFEKPRTTVGWKGLINDPYLNDSFKIQEGLHIGRKLLLDIAEIGLPSATEALDPISPQYLHDLISWSAIGARTTESQTHREMASGLSSAVGFKNGTDGGLTVAINALQSVSKPHRFLGINTEARFRLSILAEIPTVMWYCAVVTASQITTQSALLFVSKNWRKRKLFRILWSIAATRIPTRTMSCKLWLWKTFQTRFWKATNPSLV